MKSEETGDRFDENGGKFPRFSAHLNQSQYRLQIRTVEMFTWTQVNETARFNQAIDAEYDLWTFPKYNK